MSNINNKYKNIIDEIEYKIKNKEDLDFVKEKFTELSVFFIDIIDKLTSITNARLNEIEESQREIDNKISKVQSVVNNIENDIYADDENCEFEIICPYCNYQFVTDIDSEINEELIEALCVFVELDDMIIRILDKIELPVPYCSYFEEIIKKYNKIT